MAEIIATGTTQATSADFTLTDGQSTTIFFKDALGMEVTPEANALIRIKSSTNEYYTIGTVDCANPARVLQAPGTFRVFKYASTVAYGVDRS